MLLTSLNVLVAIAGVSLALFLLFAALAGDLILLPALLASPLGKVFCNVNPVADDDDDPDGYQDEVTSPGISTDANGDSAGDRDSSSRNKVEAPHMLQIRRRLSDQK